MLKWLMIEPPLGNYFLETTPSIIKLRAIDSFVSSESVESAYIAVTIYMDILNQQSKRK
jgi:hypothetical protein